ncbi:hypothetical protein H0H93_003334 [Arthromyces matolae]|nr:hypothetical protein H0H93_003334 [Arthromyces matolae]
MMTEIPTTSNNTIIEDFEATEYFPDDFCWDELDKIEQNAYAASSNPSPASGHDDGLKDLQEPCAKSQTAPFFTSHNVQDFDLDSDDEMDLDLDEEEDAPASKLGASMGTWFKKPKRMPDWLYRYFGDTIAPLIIVKNGRQLQKPPPMCESHARLHSPPSFWIHQPEPAILLARHHYDPSALFRPRVFLWLPHFYVTKLCCPRCHKTLEKNGALAPRRITDICDSFYIVTWGYYCRQGCKTFFAGWNKELMATLPLYLRHAFPAILSPKGGVSREVELQLCVGNQHKMGPCGVRSLLFEMHTHRFNIIQLQYLEAIFELVRGRQDMEDYQSTLHEFVSEKFPSIGNFSDPQGYAGYVPSESYLAAVMNRAIERDESDANQHTTCLAPDQLAIDDSHKVNKHIARLDGVPSHEERVGPLSGIADSVKRYGFSDPPIVFSDDPVKDKQMIYTAFPSLAKGLTPVAAAYGLRPIELPMNVRVTVLDSIDLVEANFASLMSPLDLDPGARLFASLDAEWNISRRVGVSIIQIAPHINPGSIFIVPVHKFTRLPTSLLRFLLSPQVVKIGSNIKGDFTRIKKQFNELVDQTSFTIIELKEYCIQHGVIDSGVSGSLDTLVEKAMGMYLSKDTSLRKSEAWEKKVLDDDHKRYAALDAYASRLVFEKASSLPARRTVSYETPPGTRVCLLMQEGGEVVAYGKVAAEQPTSLGNVRVKTPNKNRLVVDINSLLNPSSAALLHHLPRSSQSSTKSGCLTLGQLCAASLSAPAFQIVSPVTLLIFDDRPHKLNPSTSASSTVPPNWRGVIDPVLLNDIPPSLNSNNFEDDEDEHEHQDDLLTDRDFDDADTVKIDMLEAYSKTFPNAQEGNSSSLTPPPLTDSITILDKLVNSAPTVPEEYQRIKKDLFHVFHSIPMSVNHGARLLFLRALRDHLMRWDPDVRAVVDKTCRRVFNLTFDQMLKRNPRWIAERTPRHVPRPSVLVPALKHVFDTFGNALDAKTQQPLFNKVAWKKSEAIIELAQQGFLSDMEGIPMYEKSGVDKLGLQKYRSLRGTNNVEGGPHGDIYRKFGALHAGPRLTVNSLQDHRTWYNLQAFAKHLYGVNWDYHHGLGLINRTAFLLNYLADLIDGARSYSQWINGDLYERTTEQFGICPVPESLRIQLGMESYSEAVIAKYNLNKKLNTSDDWLRRRQGLALPALPPTTLEARKYFFSKVPSFTDRATAEGKSRIDWVAFAVEWNRTADGEERVYITADVLAAYAKTWENSNNIRASQELISKKLEGIQKSTEIMAAPCIPFPSFMTTNPVSIQPSQGLNELSPDPVDQSAAPPSLTVALSVSSTALPIRKSFQALSGSVVPLMGDKRTSCRNAIQTNQQTKTTSERRPVGALEVQLWFGFGGLIPKDKFGTGADNDAVVRQTDR